MKIYIVGRSFPGLDLVDDDLTIYGHNVEEIVGVFASEKKARAVQEDLVGKYAQEEIALGCDPIDVFITEYDIEDPDNPAFYKMDTLTNRDRILESLWAELSDVPFDEGETDMVLVEPWLCFDAGTERMEIWRWFDERYSRGVGELLYSTSGNDQSLDIADLYYRKVMCAYCDTECVFNPSGICMYPMVYRKEAELEGGKCKGHISPQKDNSWE